MYFLNQLQKKEKKKKSSILYYFQMSDELQIIGFVFERIESKLLYSNKFILHKSKILSNYEKEFIIESDIFIG